MAKHRRARGAFVWVLLFAGAFVVGSMGAALAYFLVKVTDPPGNNAVASAAVLSAPTSAAVTETGSNTTVKVSWTNPTTQLASARYVVVETGTAVVCTDPQTVDSCSVSNLTPGRAYTFTVHASIGTHWRSGTTTASVTTVKVTTAALPNGTVGTPYTTRLQAIGGPPGTAFTWALSSGSLPKWATLHPTGTITGTPTSAGKTTGLVFKVTDGSDVSALSVPLSITVTKRATTLDVVSLPDPSVTGEPVAIVAAPVGGTDMARPTGTVTFDLSDANGNHISCAGGTTQAIPAFLGHAVCIPTVPLQAVDSPYRATASYTGDARFKGSTGALTPIQTVNPDKTTTILTSSSQVRSGFSGSDRLFVGAGHSVSFQKVRYTASIRADLPGLGVPGPVGAVTFKATDAAGQASVLCATVPLSEGSATCTDNGAFKAVDGPYAVTATYAPTPDNYISSSATVTEDVSPAPSPFDITVTGTTEATATYGGKASLAASGLPQGATGTVTFATVGEEGHHALTLCSYSYPSRTSCTTPATLNAGSYRIGAQFTDSTGNYASTSAQNTVHLSVNPAQTDFQVQDDNGLGAASLGPSEAQAPTGSQTLGVTGLPRGASGTVTFRAANPELTLCSFSYPTSGTCTTGILPGGVYTGITASFHDATGNYTSSVSTNALGFTVYVAPSFTSGAGATFTAGGTGTVTVRTSGYPQARVGVATLPPWATLSTNGNGTATLSGSPPLGTRGSIGLTLTASNGVAPAATQSFTLTVVTPLAGLSVVDASGGVLVCSTTTQAKVTCTDSTLGATGGLSWKVELVDASGHALTNTTGEPLVVKGVYATVASPGASFTPADSTVPEGTSQALSAFSLVGKGPTWQATVVLTLTLGARTFTVTVAAS